LTCIAQSALSPPISRDACLAPFCDRLDGGQHRLAMAESQPQPRSRGPEAAFGGFDRPREGPPGANRVQAVAVAQPGGLDHDIRVADAAERSEGKQRFVFEPLFTAARREQSFALNRAGRAPVPPAEMARGERLAAQRVRSFERGLLEVPRRQRPKPVEDRQVGDRADASILVGERTEAATPQALRDRIDTSSVGDRRGLVAGHGNGLQVLRAHDRANPSAPGVPAFVTNGREADAVLTGDPDGCDADPPAHFIAYPGLRICRSLAAKLRPIPHLDAIALNVQVHERRRRPGNHQGVQAKPLQFQREVAGRQRVRDEPGEW
jgi:hypothetical protein